MIYTEENAAARIKARDPAALEYAMDMHGRTLYGLAGRILYGVGRPEDIEECVSDAFVAAWNKIEEFDERKGSFRTWLILIAKYKALDYRRKLQRLPGADPIPESAAEGRNLEEQVLAKERNREINEAIQTFSDTDRTIFYKRYFSYETIEQIAGQLGLTAKAVENRLFRSRQALKRYFNRSKEEDGYAK